MRRFQCEECDALFLGDGEAACPFCGSGAVVDYSGEEFFSSTSSATANVQRRTSPRIRRRHHDSDEEEDSIPSSNTNSTSSNSRQSSNSISTSTSTSTSSNTSNANNGDARRVRFRFSTVFTPFPADFASHLFSLVHANLNGDGEDANDNELPQQFHFATFTVNLDAGMGGNLDALLNAVFDDLMASAGAGQPRGLNDEKIGQLPAAQADDSHKDCAICREDFGGQEGEDLARLPACGHVFHRECIGSWLKRVATCPICRKGVE